MKPFASIAAVDPDDAFPGGRSAAPSAGAPPSAQIRDLISAARALPAHSLPVRLARAGVRLGLARRSGDAARPPSTRCAARPNRAQRRRLAVPARRASTRRIPACARWRSGCARATDRDDVIQGLIERLAAPTRRCGSSAALGLGIAPARRSVDPLSRGDPRCLRPAFARTPSGRWAASRTIAESRRRRRRLADRSPLVRQAAAGTLGQLEAKSASTALVRVLREDPVASVRRTTAWALTQLEAENAANDLSAQLRKGSRRHRARDVRVGARQPRSR